MSKAIARLLLCVTLVGLTACASTRPKGFESPEEAMRAIASVAGTGDKARANEILGADGYELLRSGDDVADREDALRVKAAIEEKIAFDDVDADRKVALIGKDAWPFPIPLVRESGQWRFDTEAGAEEIENRRVGRNELLAIAALHEYVDAQREYFETGHDGAPRSYARKVFSTDGKHDGLYWPTEPGEPESPLGPLIADATGDGYEIGTGAPTPFHGYYFRTLTSQGKNAPGGEKKFIDEHGVMNGGFAMVAWPAKYGSSGVMTFQVSQRGIIFQKDLGEDTDRVAQGITAYDPDATWDPVDQ
jgi:hypothetical protein